jgi:GntR family transcriptional regulator / MocR family aminotransferase
MPKSNLFLSLTQDAGEPVLRKGELIYRTLVRAILDGTLPPATRIPSSRVLADDWRMSRNTVDDALSRLLDEGLLTRRVGSGSWVSDTIPRRGSAHAIVKRRPNDAARRTLRAVSTVSHRLIDLRAGNPVPRVVPFAAGMPDLDHFPVEIWARVAARRLRKDGRALLEYLPSLGYEPLREAICRYLATARGIVCESSRLMIVNSSMQALDLVARVLLEKGDEVWVEDPGYPNVRSTLSMTGAVVVPVPLDDEGLSIERGRRLSRQPALIHVSPTFQFPMGCTMSMARRAELLNFADARGAWIVEDDYAHEFAYDSPPLAPLFSLDRSERVLYVGSFTSTMFPSLRLAYIVMPEALVEAFLAVRGQLDDHTHGVDQATLADFMDAGHFTGHVRRMRAIYRARRDVLAKAGKRHLPAGALAPIHGGLTAVLHIPASVGDRRFCADARDATGLILTPLSRFGVHAKVNGSLIGFAALDVGAIASGMKVLGRWYLDRTSVE